MGHPWKNKQDPVDRFWSKVDKDRPTPAHRPDLGPCWVWTGGVNDDGYGRFYITSTKHAQAHRFAYELLIGPFPEDLVSDHLCLNILCVNPGHIEPVTIAENTRRGAALVTHCPQGHPYDENNTGFMRNGTARRCLTCHRESTRARRALARAA